MLLTVLILHALLPTARSEEAPPPPQQVHVQRWLVTWTPPPDNTDVTYTVQSSVHGGTWTDVPTCLHTTAESCDATETATQSEHGCVMLQVRAERHGLTSTPVPACSTQGDSCSPQVSLSARRDSLTVHLNRNHSLALKDADHALHRVWYGEEGGALQLSEDSASSLTLRKLKEGRSYCAQVSFILHDQQVGPHSCPQCQLLPHTGGLGSPGVIVLGLLVVFVLISVAVYISLYHRKTIKRWLKPPCEIPDNFLLQHQAPVAVCSPSEERYDVISSVSPAERRDGD